MQLFHLILITHLSAVYATFESDLTPIQYFLVRCFERKYTSNPVSVYDFLQRQDRKIFIKVSNAKGHPLLSIMPCVKPSSHNLRKKLVLNLRLTLCILKTLLLSI